jgi:hypothetical protein
MGLLAVALAGWLAVDWLAAAWPWKFIIYLLYTLYG